MLEASARWGAGAPGREQIAVPVCKVKYQPFRPVKGPRPAAAPNDSSSGSGGGKSSRGTAKERQEERQQQQQPRERERMFACHLHHRQRKASIEKAGCRQGWQSFSAFHSLPLAPAVASRRPSRGDGRAPAAPAATTPVAASGEESLERENERATNPLAVGRSGGGEGSAVPGGAATASAAVSDAAGEAEAESGRIKRARRVDAASAM